VDELVSREEAKLIKGREKTVALRARRSETSRSREAHFCYSRLLAYFRDFA
jgi:hypothetical protein